MEARLEEQAQCILVIIGATPEGKKKRQEIWMADEPHEYECADADK